MNEKETHERAILRANILKIMESHFLPALVAADIHWIVRNQCLIDGQPASLGQVTKQLGQLEKEGIVKRRRMPTKIQKTVMVPGRVIGQYDKGMVTTLKTNLHWVLKSRAAEAYKLKKERYKSW